MITLRNLTSPAATASLSGLESLSLTIYEGEIVTIVGLPSHSRRRLLSILGLHADDWSGEYELFGHLVHKLDNDRRAALRGELVGTQMRSSPLVDCLTVEENLEIPLTYRHTAAEQRAELIADALSRLGVSSISDREVETLPPDQRQLVGIAKALVSQPRLVILEEPAFNLSPLQLRLVRRELEKLRDDGRIVVQSIEQIGSGLELDRLIELEDVTPGGRTARRAKEHRPRVSGVVSYR